MATLLIRFMFVEFQAIHRRPKSAALEFKLPESLEWVILRQFIHCPLVVASIHHDNAGETAPQVMALIDADEYDRELVTAALQHLAPANLIAARPGIREKSIHPIGRGRFLGVAAKQNHSVFCVFILPGL
jgi:hypothetical protein